MIRLVYYPCVIISSLLWLACLSIDPAPIRATITALIFIATRQLAMAMHTEALAVARQLARALGYPLPPERPRRTIDDLLMSYVAIAAAVVVALLPMPEARLLLGLPMVVSGFQQTRRAMNRAVIMTVRAGQTARLRSR